MESVSYFYVLYCQDGSFYGGYTTDLTRRELEHNQGVGAKYTKPQTRRPVKMIYAEGYGTRSEATKAEYAFKKQTRKNKIDYLINHGVVFPIQATISCLLNMQKIEAKEDEKNAKSKKF
ncbi:MAG: GIY-YIG nuclease family protein [Carnobacterium alterfunditum]